MIARPAITAPATVKAAITVTASPHNGSITIAATSNSAATIAPDSPSANGPVSTFAKRLKAPRRSTRSPVWRWAKNPSGRANSLAINRPSPAVLIQVSMATSSRRRNTIAASKNSVVTTAATVSGATQRSWPRNSTSSTNMRTSTGLTTSGTAPRAAKQISSAKLCSTPINCARRIGSRRGLVPRRRKFGPGSKVRQTPVKALSNSSVLTVREPVPGSSNFARPDRSKPSSTTKWLKFQNNTQGSLTLRKVSGSWRKPRPTKPKVAAAAMIELAFDPLRETLQRTRSSSRGTHAPW